MPHDAIGRFYDSLAETYHLVRPGWADGIARQGKALDALTTAVLGSGPRDVLDCTCGIGTQALGLAELGHRVTGTDISRESVVRARREAASRALPLGVLVGDMRALPVRTASFDVVLSGDNAVAHLLTDHDLVAALAEMHRVLRPNGMLVLTLHTYEKPPASRRHVTDPHATTTPAGPAVSFQSWRWHPDTEHYDFENIRVLPDGDRWRLAVERTTLRALSRVQLADAARRAGYMGTTWHEPEETGYFQSVFTARPVPPEAVPGGSAPEDRPR
jgi:glycine/sarcosine N-methyltransferase